MCQDRIREWQCDTAGISRSCHATEIILRDSSGECKGIFGHFRPRRLDCLGFRGVKLTVTSQPIALNIRSRVEIDGEDCPEQIRFSVTSWTPVAFAAA